MSSDISSFGVGDFDGLWRRQRRLLCRRQHRAAVAEANPAADEELRPLPPSEPSWHERV